LSTTTQKLGTWLDSFEELDKRNGQPSWLKELRHEAFAEFSRLGFPTLKNEDWRFTSVVPIANAEFVAGSGAQISPRAVDEFVLPDSGARLVFVNGGFAPELSSSSVANAPGVRIMSLREAVAAESQLIESHLRREDVFKGEAFSALNTAFLQDGAFVLVPKNTVVEKPIYVVYVSIGGVRAQMAHPRNLFVAGENSQASFVEDYVTLDCDGKRSGDGSEGLVVPGVFFSNVVSEVVAAEGANVEHYLIEREDERALNVSTLWVREGRSAVVASHSVLLGGALVRNNVHPVLAGEGADCLINGLFIGRGRQHMDNYMKVEHVAPHCTSRQFYNGILDESARGVFHGRIIVHPNAQRTDAKQTNRNLLLSDNAQIDTKPQLEIYADDVKCTHGATIGQIEEQALFYLRSRGLSEAEARGLLLYAFASESLDRMRSAPVREMLGRLIPQWLPNLESPKISSGSAQSSKPGEAK
jgi:Fe-S cluster assembly protein SufD